MVGGTLTLFFDLVRFAMMSCHLFSDLVTVCIMCVCVCVCVLGEVGRGEGVRWRWSLGGIYPQTADGNAVLTFPGCPDTIRHRQQL